MWLYCILKSLYIFLLIIDIFSRDEWLNLLALRPVYSRKTRSISWLMMMHGFLESPGHQQPWYSRYGITGSFVIHEEWFQVPAPSWYSKMIENSNMKFMFPTRIQHLKSQNTERVQFIALFTAPPISVLICSHIHPSYHPANTTYNLYVYKSSKFIIWFNSLRPGDAYMCQ